MHSNFSWRNSKTSQTIGILYTKCMPSRSRTALSTISTATVRTLWSTDHNSRLNVVNCPYRQYKCMRIGLGYCQSFISTLMSRNGMYMNGSQSTGTQVWKKNVQMSNSVYLYLPVQNKWLLSFSYPGQSCSENLTLLSETECSILSTLYKRKIQLYMYCFFFVFFVCLFFTDLAVIVYTMYWQNHH